MDSASVGEHHPPRGGGEPPSPLLAHERRSKGGGFTTPSPLLAGSKGRGPLVFVLDHALGLYSMSIEHSLNAQSRLKRGIEVQSVD